MFNLYMLDFSVVIFDNGFGFCKVGLFGEVGFRYVISFVVGYSKFKMFSAGIN